MKSAIALTWEDLAEFSSNETDRIHGPTNPYSSIRLFNQKEDKIRVTLFRDHHAWCPYCQKIWLWLELKQIPYRVRKVTMRCYGKKEDWYLKKVPTGMLPALEIDQQIVTESDQILFVLEKAFGPLGSSLENSHIFRLRKLERELFRAWCLWLCKPVLLKHQERKRKVHFQNIASKLEDFLNKSNGPFLDLAYTRASNVSPGVGDIIFIPYIERMNASLAYYKGYCLREQHPSINEWLKGFELLDEYRGTQGDFHTHAHDLPPQMGGCWRSPSQKQQEIEQSINSGEGMGAFEFYPSVKVLKSANFKAIALTRVIKHKNKIIEINTMKGNNFDQPLRAALTTMVSDSPCQPTKDSASGLRYLKDRISVPRDMPLLAARELRQALEKTAQLDGGEQGVPISKSNRMDQDPLPFQ